MVAPPPVWGLIHNPRRWWGAIAAYMVAMFAGAFVLAGLVTALSTVVSISSEVTAIIGFAMLPVVLLVNPLALPQSRWRIPRQWDRLGKVRYAAAFGFILGLTVLTALPAVSFLFLLAYALQESVSENLIVFACFGLARSLPVILAARHASLTETFPVEVTDRLTHLARKLRPLEATLLLVSSVTLIAH